MFIGEQERAFAGRNIMAIVTQVQTMALYGMQVQHVVQIQHGWLWHEMGRAGYLSEAECPEEELQHFPSDGGGAQSEDKHDPIFYLENSSDSL